MPDAISLPIMVYNNPATANVDLSRHLRRGSPQIDNCLYIKESTLEVTRVRDIIRLCGDRMTVFGGILGFEFFVEGAQGWVAVASNVVPQAMARISASSSMKARSMRRASSISTICR